jgi:hypothetical protein
MPTGKCHCGAIRYEMTSEVIYHAVCHCTDCRRATGAPMVSWGLAPADKVAIEGEPKVYASSEHGRRHFCGECGTSLFYTNDIVFPGLIDVQTATLDDPEFVPVGAQVQVAERVGWVTTLHQVPEFERYPAME